MGHDVLMRNFKQRLRVVSVGVLAIVHINGNDMISELFVKCSTEASGTYPAIVIDSRTRELAARPLGNHCQERTHNCWYLNKCQNCGYGKRARAGDSAKTVAGSRPFFQQ
jgi:hypothetical protein